MPYAQTDLVTKPTPESGEDSVTLYRYMDFGKFLNLLQGRRLHFHQAADFDDRFEGTIPDDVRKAREIAYEQAGDGGPTNEEHEAITKCLRRFTYLSCWHAQKTESVAMWDKYGASDRAVAIRTTFDRFKDALALDGISGNDEPSHEVYIGKVSYRSYQATEAELEDVDPDDVDPRFLLTGNPDSIVPFVCKRKGFAYEKEVRAIIQQPPTDDSLEETKIERLIEREERIDDVEVTGSQIEIDTTDGMQYLDTRKRSKTKGLNKLVNLRELIEQVHVAPDAPGWFKETVYETVENSLLTRERSVEDVVEESILDHDPNY